MTTSTPATSPTEIYLAGLSSGSRHGMRQSLDTIAGMLSDAPDAESFPWWEVTYRDSMAVRIALTERYKPATVNQDATDQATGRSTPLCRCLCARDRPIPHRAAWRRGPNRPGL